MNDVKHIFFDLDHTLWDFDANSKETLAELFVLFDLSSKVSGFDVGYFQQRYIYHNDRMWEMYRNNRMSKSRLRTARFEAALRDIRIEDKRLAKDISKTYLELCPQKKKLKEGAFEVVETLSKIRPLSIISNGFQESQLIKLEASGLNSFFQEVITSERANSKKPQARIFQLANALTKTEKAHSVMIGDNLKTDIEGARAFGWRAIHYDDKSPHSDEQTVNELKKLLDFFEA